MQYFNIHMQIYKMEHKFFSTTACTRILKYAFLILIITTSSAAMCQMSYLGIKGGANNSNLHAENANKTRSREGYNIGLFTQIELKKRLGIAIETLYSTKGARLSEIGLSRRGIPYQIDHELFANYIEIPILVYYELVKTVQFQAGLHIGFLAGSRLNSQATINIGQNDLLILNKLRDFKKDLNGLDLGFSFGLNFPFEAIVLGIRYNQGLSAIANNSSEEDVRANIKNATWSFHIGFNILNMAANDR